MPLKVCLAAKLAESRMKLVLPSFCKYPPLVARANQPPRHRTQLQLAGFKSSAVLPVHLRLPPPLAQWHLPHVQSSHLCSQLQPRHHLPLRLPQCPELRQPHLLSLFRAVRIWAADVEGKLMLFLKAYGPVYLILGGSFCHFLSLVSFSPGKKSNH